MKKIVIILAVCSLFGCSRKQRSVFQVEPFDLNQVRLLEGHFKNAMELDKAYIMSLEPDRLLYFFYETAGLPSDSEPYGGWENKELRGHTLGHYLSACALMYASTGDETIRQKADYIVGELAKCQKAIGSGYLSAFPESFISLVERRKKVWAPYYTLHKILAGLVDMYQMCRNQQALEVAEKMAMWLKGRCDKISNTLMQIILNVTEQGGIIEPLANLYSITGNPEYLSLAMDFVQDSYLKPLTERKDELKGLHANSYIPNVVAYARLYELTGDIQYQNATRYFWQEVALKRSFSTGGTSSGEMWRTGPGILASEISFASQETCCTYNMLKLTRHLFCWLASPEYMDFYERGLLNHILASQNPENGAMIYFLSLGHGNWKIYNSHDSSFWCCTGTGLENHAKYTNIIYFHDDHSLYVNLFIASELTWRQKGMRIIQKTRFPEQETTFLTIHTEEPVRMPIYIRIPYWATGGVEIEINGQQQKIRTQPTSYVKLNKKWNNGDEISVHIPMELHLDPLPDDENVVTIMYGPVVLAGALGKEGLTREMMYGTGDVPRSDQFAASFNSHLYGDKENLDWIQPVGSEPLTYKIIDAEDQHDITLIPLYKIYDQRYNVYWSIKEK